MSEMSDLQLTWKVLSDKNEWDEKLKLDDIFYTFDQIKVWRVTLWIWEGPREINGHLKLQRPIP